MKIIPIAQWSASKYETFSKCAFRAQLQYGQKIPEPARPLPPGKTEHANDRGTRIHNAAELYVQNKGPLVAEMEKFRPEFESLKSLYAAGKVSLEGEWAMDKNWNPVPWASKEAWLRLKLDAIVFLSEFEAVVIDYKSGKRYGNEIKHAEQTQLYQLVSLIRYPKLEVIHTELWYLDVDEIAHSVFNRNQGMRFLPSFTRKGRSITECIEFKPNPHMFNCQKAYCPYGTWEGGTGHCTVGIPR